MSSTWDPLNHDSKFGLISNCFINAKNERNFLLPSPVSREPSPTTLKKFNCQENIFNDLESKFDSQSTLSYPVSSKPRCCHFPKFQDYDCSQWDIKRIEGLMKSESMTRFVMIFGLNCSEVLERFLQLKMLTNEVEGIYPCDNPQKFLVVFFDLRCSFELRNFLVDNGYTQSIKLICLPRFKANEILIRSENREQFTSSKVIMKLPVESLDIDFLKQFGDIQSIMNLSGNSFLNHTEVRFFDERSANSVRRYLRHLDNGSFKSSLFFPREDSTSLFVPILEDLSGPKPFNNPGNKIENFQFLKSHNTNPEVTPKNVVAQSNEFSSNLIINGMDKRTTLMIRNIPNKYSQTMLIDFLNKTHFGEYDFIYLRMDFQNKCNMGYAFINFVGTDSVLSFAKGNLGKKWSNFNSEKICDISYANIQGKSALVEKFRNSRVMLEDPSYRPKIFYSSGVLKGYEEPFPPPTNGQHNQR